MVVIRPAASWIWVTLVSPSANSSHRSVTPRIAGPRSGTTTREVVADDGVGVGCWGSIGPRTVPRWTNDGTTTSTATTPASATHPRQGRARRRREARPPRPASGARPDDGPEPRGPSLDPRRCTARRPGKAQYAWYRPGSTDPGRPPLAARDVSAPQAWARRQSGDSGTAAVRQEVTHRVDRRDLDHRARVRRVDHLAAADVEPDVVAVRPAGAVEDEVTRLELGDGTRSVSAHWYPV